MRNPSPTLAALLSFIFPGLGQIYAGDAKKGVIWAIPMLLILLAGAWLVFGGKALSVVTSSNAQLAILIFNVAFFLYHIAAMIDAYDVARRDRAVSYSRPRGAPIALAALIALAIIIHGFPEVYGYEGYVAFHDIVPTTPRPVRPSFEGQTANPSVVIPTDPPATPGASTPGPSGSGPSTTPGGSPGPRATRTPLPPIAGFPGGWPEWAQDGRLNLLLIGGDSRSDTGLDAKSLRTDSMILLSEDIQSGKAALFSFPRNLCTATDGSCGDGTRYPDWLQLQLPQEDTQSPAGQAAFPNGNFTASPNLCQGMNSDGLLTSLWHVAAYCDSVFQGSDGISGNDCQQQFDCDRAWRALVGTLQNFTGQSIDGVVAVNLNGFVDLVSNLPSQCPTDAQRVALPSTPKCYGGLWLQTDSVQDDAYFDSQQQQIPVNFKSGCFYVDPEYRSHTRGRATRTRITSANGASNTSCSRSAVSLIRSRCCPIFRDFCRWRRQTCTRRWASRTSNSWLRPPRASMPIGCTRRTSRPPMSRRSAACRASRTRSRISSASPSRSRSRSSRTIPARLSRL